MSATKIVDTLQLRHDEDIPDGVTVRIPEHMQIDMTLRKFLECAGVKDPDSWACTNGSNVITAKIERVATGRDTAPEDISLHIDGQHVNCRKFRFETPRHVHYICDGPVAKERILGPAGFCVVITGPQDPWWNDKKPHTVTICSADKMLHVKVNCFIQAGNGDYAAVMQDEQPPPTWSDILAEWREAHVLASLEKARAQAVAAKQRGIVTKNPDGTWKFVPDEDRKPKLGGPGKSIFKMEVPADLGSSGDEQIDRFIKGMIQIFRQSLPVREN